MNQHLHGHTHTNVHQEFTHAGRICSDVKGHKCGDLSVSEIISFSVWVYEKKEHTGNKIADSMHGLQQ